MHSLQPAPKVARTLQDPKLGVLPLMRETWAHPDNPKDVRTYFRKECEKAGGVCSFSEGRFDTPMPGPPLCDRAIAVVDDAASLIERAAKGVLEPAGPWAAAGDLPEPMLASLIAAFELDLLALQPDETSLYIREAQDFFAGHVEQIPRTPAGDIKEIGLAG